MKKLISSRKYSLFDFISINLRVCPGITLLRVVSQIFSALVPSIQVIVTAMFVDTALAVFAGTAEYASVFLPMAYLLLLTMYDNLQWSLTSFMGARVNMKLPEAIKPAILEKRARLEFRHIENNATWDLISRVCKDPVGRMTDGFSNIISAVYICVRITSILLLLVTQVWWAALVMIAVCIPLFIIAIKSGKTVYDADKEAMKHSRRAEYLNKVLSDRESVEERAMFAYSDDVNKRWHNKYENARKIRMKADASRFMRMKGASLITVLISLVIIGVLLYPLSLGEITIGMFMGLVTATFGLVQMMSWQLSYTMSELANGREYMKDLTEFAALSEQDGALDKPQDGLELERVEFKHVSFRYPDTEKDILKDFSITIEKNRHYAFVGVNGAGKTTITKLLTGMYSNFEGEILINGRSIREYTNSQLKSLFSVVYQDFAKYYIPIRDNITLGDVNVTDDARLAEVVATIGLDDAVAKLPDGMNTWLGKIKEDGVDMSGGEWQRVAIARTLYGKAGMRILDEPTAALDPVAESNIYEMFGRISAGRTTIFITHRLGAARLADEIVVLDGGRVAELGSHNQLMAQNGIYAEMFESQRSWYK